MISPVPQIEQFRLESNWEFLVVATDGVWDAMSNADILKYLASRLDNKNRYQDKDRGCTRYRDLPKDKDKNCTIGSGTYLSTRTGSVLGTGTYLRTKTGAVLGTGTSLSTRTGTVLGTGTVLRNLWKEKFHLSKLGVTKRKSYMASTKR